MIAKRARKSANRSLKRTCMYIADQRNTQDFEHSKTGGKAENVRFSNLNSTTLYEAFLEMEETQALNTRSKSDKNYHLIVSFPVGEKPSEIVLQDIENNLVERIGLGEHQRISIVHNDTDHFHFHVLINKIHPVTNNNVEPFYDKKDLMKVCDEMEVKHGLQKVNHSTSKKIKLTESEIFRNEESLTHFLKERISTFSNLHSWEKFHIKANTLGIKLKKRGAGLVFEDMSSGITVKASSIARKLSLKKLESKFGTFEDGEKIYERRESNNSERDPGRGRNNSGGNASVNGAGATSRVFIEQLKRLYQSYDSESSDFFKTESINDLRKLSSIIMDGDTEKSNVLLPVDEVENVHERRASNDPKRVRWGRKGLSNDGSIKGYDKDRFIQSSALYAQYKKEIHHFYTSRKKLSIQHKNEQQRFKFTMKNWLESEKKAIKMKGGSFKDRKIKYQTLSLKAKSMREQFYARQAKERADLPNKPSWNEYLKSSVLANNEYSEVALKTLRSQNKKLISKMELDFSNKESIFHNFDSKVRLNGTIAYNLSNRPAVLDRAKDLKVELLDEKSVLLALMVATQKFNDRPLTINGSEEFKKLVVKVINENSLNVSLHDKQLSSQLVNRKPEVISAKDDAHNTKTNKR